MVTVGEATKAFINHDIDVPKFLTELRSDKTLDEKTLDELLKKDETKDADLIKRQILSSPWWDVRGLGPKTAVKLWEAGVRDLNKSMASLPVQSQLWLIYKPLPRIPRQIVEEIARAFMPTSAKWQIVGSFRRERPTVGDIDIMYWGANLHGLLKRITKTHGVKWHMYAEGASKIGGIFQYKPDVVVEVDLWITTPEARPFMLLYATGSQRWNIIMRQQAKNKGLKLNQYGLYKDDKRIPLKSEREIFEYLGMKWREPKDRN